MYEDTFRYSVYELWADNMRMSFSLRKHQLVFFEFSISNWGYLQTNNENSQADNILFPLLFLYISSSVGLQ